MFGRIGDVVKSFLWIVALCLVVVVIVDYVYTCCKLQRELKMIC